MKTLTQTLSAVALACAMAASTGVAHADIAYYTGNQQYTNVNIDADVIVGGTPLSAYIDSQDRVPFYFANPLDANGNPIAYLHGANGVATVEAFQCNPNTDPACQNTTTAKVPFFSLELYIDSSKGISAMDWKLDQWDDKVPGTATFTGYDINGNLMPVSCNGASTDTFALGNGQQGFQLTTCDGDLLHKLVVTATGSGLSDIKQVSVEDPPITTPMPEPGSLALTALGLTALALRRRRNY